MAKGASASIRRSAGMSSQLKATAASSTKPPSSSPLRTPRRHQGARAYSPVTGLGLGQWPSTSGTRSAGGVLRLRPQRTMPSIITMPMPGMSPSCTLSSSVLPGACAGRGP